MRTIRIFQPGDYQAEQTIQLTPEAGQHVGVVLRMWEGEPLTLFNGDNYEYQATIIEIHKKKVLIKIDSRRLVNRESGRIIHLTQAVSKGDRMEMVVQKAVELGVSSITPVITEHCAVKLDQERSQKKCQQWQAIAVAACEQSGRNVVPVVNPMISFSQFLAQPHADLNFVLYPEAQKNWRTYQFAECSIGLIIGPEGGLSSNEIAQLFTAGFQPLSLGPRVLRTETAAITALSVLQAVCGDL
ncbi:16S rRNA (uracil(1498)-N(3))-methyltransferase [Legionella dresdenensis]|uniref:Ribosomal RNA small subunit methyltransferase E n=1 Tax=Legionella dresdenensis TaxID=450200 RepID=A0ABV8CD12_9GAMM